MTFEQAQEIKRELDNSNKREEFNKKYEVEFKRKLLNKFFRSCQSVMFIDPVNKTKIVTAHYGKVDGLGEITEEGFEELNGNVIPMPTPCAIFPL